MRALRRLVCFLTLTAIGCGESDGRVKLYPVSGKVLVNRGPAEGARIVFYPMTADGPEASIPTPAATTDANGEFHLGSYELDDGAPAGEYQVTVVWPEPPPKDLTGIHEAGDRLQGRYADPQMSQLTATVEPGGGEIPAFELR